MNTEAYKSALHEELEQIEGELNRLGRKTTEDGDWVVVPDEGDGNHADPIDNADRIEDFEEKIAVLKVLESRHTHVKEALAALEDGSYGSCTVCDQAIDPKRLEADPALQTCAEHAV